MKHICLSQGKVAIVNNSDFVNLSRWKWNALRGRDGKFYAVRTSQKSESPIRKTIYMHRVILGVTRLVEVDHKDGDGLNNKRRNLRTATATQNRRNQGLERCNNTSGFKGVTWHKNRNKWQAQIGMGGRKRKVIYLGLYSAPREAAIAYDLAAKKLYGRFARLNFPKN